MAVQLSQRERKRDTFVEQPKLLDGNERIQT